MQGYTANGEQCKYLFQYIPLVLGHIEGDLISLMNVPLIIDISESIRNEEKLSTAFVDDSSHPRVSVGLAGLQGEKKNRHWDECLGVCQ